MARLVETLEKYRSSHLRSAAAAELLGISERHFRRLRERYEEEGAEGLIDRRRGKASARRVEADKIEWVVEQFRTRYWDFTVKHFHEALQGESASTSVTPGPRRSCSSAAWCEWRPSARRIARSGHAGRCRG